MDDRIERLQRRSAKNEGILSLAGGLPANELFPRQKLASAFLSVVSRPNCEALQYGWPEGSEGLRKWIADRLRGRGADVSPDDVIVTSGAQQALAIAVELIGIDGRVVATEEETYPGALDLFRDRGAKTASASRATNADAACIYVVAGASNPRGLPLSELRRAELLASGRPLLVDEAYAELRFDGYVAPPFLVDARDRTFHIGTFSKTLCPGLRVGWLVAPPELAADALRVKRDLDLQAGSMAQAVVEGYLALDDFDQRIVRARKTYASRAGRLVRALRRYMPEARWVEPEGAFAVFVETDLEGVDEAHALAIANAHGVSYDPGSMFRPGAALDPFGFRLCYSSRTGEEIEEAVQRLARALGEVRARKAA
jgi:2-aminoadipate transaminase